MRKIVVPFLMLGLLVSPTTQVNAQSTSIECEKANATATSVKTRILSASAKGEVQTFSTELIFDVEEEDVSEIRLVFSLAANNRNFAKCPMIGKTKRITIPYDYGQLPLVLDLWNTARGNENIDFKCQFTRNDDDERTGLCKLEGEKK